MGHLLKTEDKFETKWYYNATECILMSINLLKWWIRTTGIGHLNVVCMKPDQVYIPFLIYTVLMGTLQRI